MKWLNFTDNPVLSYLWSGHGFLVLRGKNSHSRSLPEFCRIRSFCPLSAPGPPCDNVTVQPESTTFDRTSKRTTIPIKATPSYLSSWHISRFSLCRGVRRRTLAPSSSVLMSELSCWLQRLNLWTPAATAWTEPPLQSAASAADEEVLAVVPATPEPLESAALAAASAPSGLLSEGQTAVILQGMQIFMSTDQHPHPDPSLPDIDRRFIKAFVIVYSSQLLFPSTVQMRIPQIQSKHNLWLTFYAIQREATCFNGDV